MNNYMWFIAQLEHYLSGIMLNMASGKEDSTPRDFCKIHHMIWRLATRSEKLTKLAAANVKLSDVPSTFSFSFWPKTCHCETTVRRAKLFQPEEYVRKVDPADIYICRPSDVMNMSKHGC